MKELHIFFFPFMAHGHMIPILDIAKLFASRGVRSTIITTPLNAHYFKKRISKAENQLSGIEIEVKTIKFPSIEAGLPENCENCDHVPSEDLSPNFFVATSMLKDQVDQLLEEHQPSCLVADMFFPWATDIAAKYNIPRLVFYGTGFFAMCASESVRMYNPQFGVSSDDEPFLLPNLPHEIRLTRKQLIPELRQVSKSGPDMLFGKLLDQIKESEFASYGIIVNSFKELEPDYVDHYRNILKLRAWHIGPVSLCNRGIDDMAQRGKGVALDQYAYLKWLDSKKLNSVVYVCFGTMNKFSASQLHEIALGLEASEQNFIWVIKKGESNEEKDENEMQFEERTKDKGLVIRGWAPQVLILNHEAIGCFVTHCGWNSTLEGVVAGVPMVTWPLFGEQFYNEKLVTEVMKVGIGVGAKEWQVKGESAGVGRNEIARAVKRVMVSEEGEEMRERAKGLKHMAKRAMEEGGSSYSNLDNLLEELRSYH